MVFKRLVSSTASMSGLPLLVLSVRLELQKPSNSSFFPLDSTQAFCAIRADMAEWVSRILIGRQCGGGG